MLSEGLHRKASPSGQADLRSAKKDFSPERTKACPELAVALSVVEGEAEGVVEEVAEWVEREASGHRIGFILRGECEILRGVYP